MSRRLLIVDDELAISDALAEAFELKGFAVEKAQNTTEALEKITTFRPEVLFLDIDLRGDGLDRSGAELLKIIRSNWSKNELVIIMISGVGDAQLLRELLEQGADDYEIKAVDFKALLKKVEHFLNQKEQADNNLTAVWKEALVGKSKVILNLTLNIWRAAQVGSDILILGETGTGKDLAANLYHQFSQRRDKPFYQIDCTNIAPNLFESEIFGYVQGGFTEAKRTKKGKIEEADGGIAFFNEIGDLPPEQQAKLLTLLENKTITRVGSNQPIQLEIIILFATSRNLYHMVENGQFRKDLYYRLLNQVIVIPPLRDHKDDIPHLLEHFIQKYNAVYNKQIHSADEELIEYLKTLNWPGNVRQLQHVIGAGVHQAIEDQLTLKDVMPHLLHSELPDSATAPLNQMLGLDYQAHKQLVDSQAEKMQKAYLQHHLVANGWNVSKTAERIGISREYLTQLIRRFELRRE